MTTQYLDTQSNTLVQQLARFIRNLNYRDKAQLVELVPELQLSSPDITPISAKQSKLMNFFNAFADDDAEPLPDNAIFVQGLTFAKFFALPENEQSKLWNAAHVDMEKNLGDRQKEIELDALPA